MTLVVSGLWSTPVSTRQRAARLGGAGIQVESVAFAAAAWLVKTSSAVAVEGMESRVANVMAKAASVAITRWRGGRLEP